MCLVEAFKFSLCGEGNVHLKFITKWSVVQKVEKVVQLKSYTWTLHA